ncbi:DNA-binding transcriptional regulator LsrR (DeoR family) [Bacillus tianshenii]|uniref:DNA-binding transcriptional regulator LsrR (DeoR family) n=1 Tax=Sutcliffiella tianshenii TaxID=1463404 RepID=A0ABS2NY91_9BACI|nr:sugar-binding transcriptional regulator [Bacillus tianshenii]MBM7619205.1 DNA-binding transcriptional regulator LsrR (DeoR family) [Bacillus tianshenii]
MIQDKFTENLLIKVAWYYYKDNMTQNEIAELLEVSRTKVVRLLERARMEGVVQFNIRGMGTNCLGMEKEFKEAFSLPNAFIIPTPPDIRDLSDSLSRAAAQYIQHKLQPDDLIGLGWGKAVSRTIDYLALDPNLNVCVVTLTGGVNYYLHNRSSSDRGMEKFHHISIIPAPFLASSEEMAESFLSEPSIKDILELGTLSKYILVGIGGVSPDATIIQEEKMTLNELTFIKQRHAVGDILGQFFDRDGNVIPLPHHKRLIGLDINRLKEMNNVLAVAGGDKKLDAIYGALKGGYIHTLVTDETTARALMKMEVNV